MSPELVVFDIAGTTVRDDDGVNRSLRDALAAFGVDVDREAINAIMGLPKPVAIRLVMEGVEGRSPDDRRVMMLHEEFVRRMIRYYATDPAISEMPGAESLFLDLRRRGIRVALDTGFSQDIVEALMGRLGWEVVRTLDAIVCSDEVANGRPSPDLVFEAMRRVGVNDVRRVAKVGDTPSDLEEGAAAGCG
jgi:phosphonatase-like hydrolase